jgi:hypothetical protein
MKALTRKAPILVKSQTCCNVHGNFRPDQLEVILATCQRFAEVIGPACEQTWRSLNGRRLPRTSNSYHAKRCKAAPSDRSAAFLNYALSKKANCSDTKPPLADPAYVGFRGALREGPTALGQLTIASHAN